MQAIVKIGSQQLLVKVGDVIFVEKLDAKEGEERIFKEVLVVDDQIGAPFVENAFVKVKVEKQGKKKKIVVYRHNPKSTHKRKLGHRQLFTRLLVTEIKI